MVDVVYRKFQKDDAGGVYTVARESWGFTYGKIFKKSFIDQYLEDYYSQEALLKLLTKIESNEHFFYVAIINYEIVGYCHIFPKNASEMGLARIYVFPEYFRKGIGKTSIGYGEEFVKSKSINKYFCYVHKQNDIGKSFYIKSGFRHVKEKDLHGNQIEDCHYYMEKIL